jgi:tyrosyl-tRNA synthetase
MFGDKIKDLNSVNDEPEQKDIELVSNIFGQTVEKSGFLKSKSEAQREMKGNSISVNKQKVNDTFTANETDLIDGKFLLLQKGKKSY